MTDTMQDAVLRRMISRDRGVPDENPLTTSRAVRLTLTKAANDAVGLVLTVSSVSEYTSSLDPMLAELPAGLMLVGLMRENALVGFIAMDADLRAAVIEMETMGVLAAQAAEERPPTSADLAMCRPLIAEFLSALPDAVLGTDLAGWSDGVDQDGRIADVRAAGLILEDRHYRVLQMDVQLTTTDRQGTLLIALPPVSAVTDGEDVAPVAQPDLDWAAHFPDLVASAPASLTALLHQFQLPLDDAHALQVGTVLPLAGCNVSSVRLLAPDGQEVSQAKLGQSGGMRAVRIEAAPAPDLHALDTSQGAVASAGHPEPDLIAPEIDVAPISPDEAEPVDFDPGTMLSDDESSPSQDEPLTF